MTRRTLDYDSLAHASIEADSRMPAILESYRGGDIVVWQGRIGQQIEDMADNAEDSGNIEYAKMLRKFLATWEGNEIGGSLNVEPINILKNAAEWAAAFPWTFKRYFHALRDNLKKLLASLEELPTTPPVEKSDQKPQRLGGAGGPSKPTDELDAEKPASEFGPEQTNDNEASPGEDRTANPEDLAKDIEDAVGSNSRK